MDEYCLCGAEAVFFTVVGKDGYCDACALEELTQCDSCGAFDHDDEVLFTRVKGNGPYCVNCIDFEDDLELEEEV